MKRGFKFTYLEAVSFLILHRGKHCLIGLSTPFWLVAIILGALHTWASRHSINSMGIAYLDMGEAYLRGDWDMAINAYWSPLYSWLLGIALLILKPSSYWEFSVVHLVNFWIYLFALGCFHFFLLGLIRFHCVLHGHSTFSKWIWMVFGYTLFVWSSLYWITLESPTPDLTVAGFVYLASGLILRVGMGATEWLTFVLLGVVLGLAYLAKASMFPIALIFLGITLFSVKNLRVVLPRILLSVMVFFGVCGPFILALSITQGHFTFGEAGKLNYAWIVNSVPQFRHWQGTPLGSGTPEHPTRKISDFPIVYEFAAPVKGTYPPWYDPSYWHKGLKIHFTLKKQLHVIASNLKYNFRKFHVLIVGLLILNLMSSSPQVFCKSFLKNWALWIPAIAAFSMYCLVSMQPRYIAPFMVIFCCALFSSVSLPKSKELKILLVRATNAVLLLIISPTLTYSAAKAVAHGNHFVHTHWQVADGLARLGIKPGSKVVCFCSDKVYTGIIYAPGKVVPWLSMPEYWARLARVQIVAEIDYGGSDIFWALDDSAKAELIKKLEGTGAQLIVAKNPPIHLSISGWQRIPNTTYYAYIFSKNFHAGGWLQN